MVQLYRVFAYLKKYHNSEILLIPSDQVIYQADYERQNQNSGEFGHVSGKEYIPPNMPDPHGLGFLVTKIVDAYHNVETVTQSYSTGFIIYVNSVLVQWMSKKQTSCESSYFGSNFFP